MTRFVFANGLTVERDASKKPVVWRLAVKGSEQLGPNELRVAAAEAEVFVKKMREAADKIELDQRGMEA